ncbi:LacI family DNA-binding transcriptional regulator [Paenibacillus athensensis]|nr:LacI family DNA-binding transcriptional regulator [Paenibacillus athensensis]MCD1259900.1 LacI family DNA-binding transcriptional regulator [Paenibacillus athensensis]
MKKKYTTMDIASLLNMSRTTVSKALNNHPEVPEHTKRLVLETALNLGYKKFLDTKLGQLNVQISSIRRKADTKTIAFLIKSSINIFQHGFWGDVLRGVEEASRQHGYQLVFNFLTEEDLQQGRVPETITKLKPEGIVLAGITRRELAKSLVELHIPFVLIDGYLEPRQNEVLCDSVMMENEQSVYELTNHLLAHHHRRIGFIGDVNDCKSFMERWTGFKRAMFEAGLPVRQEYCLIHPSPENYFKLIEFSEKLDAMKQLPSAFVCANDLIAFQLIHYLEARGLRIPEDVSVTGFDYMRHHADMTPVQVRLATAEVNGGEIGSRAFEQLLWRGQHPERPFETVRISTRIIGGETVGFAGSNE